MERGESDEIKEHAKRMEENRPDPEGSSQSGQIAELESEDLARELRGAIDLHYERMGAGPILNALERAIDDHIESERIKKLEANVQLTLID